MRRAIVFAAALLAAAGHVHADCLGEAKAALEARLSALPIRETLESDRDGEHQKVVVELETLQRLHTVTQGSASQVEILVLDGKGWSREKGRWTPFAAAAATAEATADDERAMAAQLTDGAVATCLGAVDMGGQHLTGYELKLEGDPSSGAPYSTLHLYVDPKTGLPVSLDMSGQGETGLARAKQTFEYLKGFKLVF